MQGRGTQHPAGRCHFSLLLFAELEMQRYISAEQSPDPSLPSCRLCGEPEQTLVPRLSGLILKPLLKLFPRAWPPIKQ